MDRLHRTRLLIGDDGVARLRAATVMVVGCGAVGAFAIEALARAGVGRLIIIDCDVVEESNINRQLFAVDSTRGVAKVDAAAARIRDINPETRVDAINMFWDTGSNIESRPDFVIDAIDSVDSKIALYKWCTENNIPVAASMGAARKTDPTRVKITRLSKTSVCPLAARVRRLARDNELPDIPVVFSDEVADKNVTGRTFGSIITVTGTFGLFLADMAIKHILNN